jgi:hypothetical protein
MAVVLEEQAQIAAARVSFAANRMTPATPVFLASSPRRVPLA